MLDIYAMRISKRNDGEDDGVIVPILIRKPTCVHTKSATHKPTCACTKSTAHAKKIKRWGRK